MRIYVDIDDVMCETARSLCGFADRMFGRKVAYEDVFEFDLRVSFSLDDRQIAELMDAAHEPDAMDSFPETPGASETVLSWVERGDDVTFVTGRPAVTHDATCHWMAERGLGAVPILHVDKFGRYLGQMFGTLDYLVPLEDFLKMEFDFAVEDSPLGLGHLAKIPGCRVAAFDRPWNAKFALPGPQFRRCATWRDVAAFRDSAEAKSFLRTASRQ